MTALRAVNNAYAHRTRQIKINDPPAPLINKKHPFILVLLEANKLSWVVAHNLSGLRVTMLEVTDETDRIDAGGSGDAI